MHHLHTTPAIVLDSSPDGESSRTYRLITKDKGLIYAHARSVRELANRNRYALRTAACATITLVKGRQVWRITSAQGNPSYPDSVQYAAFRRILATAGRVTGVEDPHTNTYDMLHDCAESLALIPESEHSVVELVYMVRLLSVLGYVSQSSVKHIDTELLNRTTVSPSSELLQEVASHRDMLASLVKEALDAAQL